MPTKNHFAVLGIDIGADEDQVKKAYRTLAKKWHPDKNKDAGAKEKFQEIAASYEYLSSTDRREMLERELRKATAAPPPHVPQQQQQQQQQRQQNGTTHDNTSFSSKPQNAGPSSTKSSPSSSQSSKPRASGSAKSKTKAPHWSESFTKNSRKTQQNKPGASGGNSSEKNSQSSKAQPKFNFRSYVSTPSGDEDDENYFQDLFGDFFFNAMGFRDLSGRQQPSTHSQDRPRPGRARNVAHETGFSEGLDDEYMFSPRREQDDPTEKLPCPWCGQLFTRGKLNQHEEKCGKFGLSADEDEDDDGVGDDDDVYGGYDSDDIEDDFSYYSNSSSNFGQRGYGRRPSWQQKHEETRSKIRRDKMRYRDRVASQGTRNAGYVTCPYCLREFSSEADWQANFAHLDAERLACYVTCPYCLREFSSEAGAKHMAWCKEHTERFGRPLNPKPNMARSGVGNRNKGGGPEVAGRRGTGAAPTGSSGTAPSRPAGRDRTTQHGTSDGAFPGFGPFSQRENVYPPRTGNDQPFPTHGPRIPDMFDIRGTKMAGTRSQARGPNITIGLGRGPKISVGISTAKESGVPSGPSATFTADASRKPNGGFKVRLNLNTNFDRKNKPGSYASSFGTKR